MTATSGGGSAVDVSADVSSTPSGFSLGFSSLTRRSVVKNRGHRLEAALAGGALPSPPVGEAALPMVRGHAKLGWGEVKAPPWLAPRSAPRLSGGGPLVASGCPTTALISRQAIREPRR